jgi:hypothetical protein
LHDVISTTGEPLADEEVRYDWQCNDAIELCGEVNHHRPRREEGMKEGTMKSKKHVMNVVMEIGSNPAPFVATRIPI